MAEKLRSGERLHDALKDSVRDFDGPFAYVLSTSEEVGAVRDKLGSRPLLVADTEELVLIASEEAVIKAVDPHIKVRYVKPRKVLTWRARR